MASPGDCPQSFPPLSAPSSIYSKTYTEVSDPFTLVFSDFRHTGAERNKIFAFLSEFATTLDCPVFEGFPYGHCADCRLLDFRRKVSISADGVVTWE